MLGCSETKREEDLNWFPRPTALCKFRSWRALNRFKQVQEERGCSNTWILTVSSGPPPSYSAQTAAGGDKRNKTPVASEVLVHL